MVSLTYGYKDGYFIDCDDASGFGESDDTLDATLTVDNGDYFKIEGTCDAAGDEIVKYTHTPGTSISTSVYTNYLIRYKTSEASSGIGLAIVLIFSDASNQWILGTDDVPVFSSTWALASGSVTSGKTLTSIRIIADDYPDTLAAGTFQAYVDFIMLYKGTFTLPNTAGGFNMDFPPREAVIGIPGRDTNIKQNLGSEDAIVNIISDLNQGNWKRTGDTIDAEVFLDILHNRSGEPWQWLDTGSHQFKVSVYPKFRWENNGNKTSRLLDLLLKEYSLGNKDDESYAERYGIGL